MNITNNHNIMFTALCRKRMATVQFTGTWGGRFSLECIKYSTMREGDTISQVVALSTSMISVESSMTTSPGARQVPVCEVWKGQERVWQLSFLDNFK